MQIPIVPETSSNWSSKGRSHHMSIVIGKKPMETAPWLHVDILIVYAGIRKIVASGRNNNLKIPKNVRDGVQRIYRNVIFKQFWDNNLKYYTNIFLSSTRKSKFCETENKHVTIEIYLSIP